MKKLKKRNKKKLKKRCTNTLKNAYTNIQKKKKKSQNKYSKTQPSAVKAAFGNKLHQSTAGTF